nr:hypothetical protein BaRGS_033334 [Batillaria attramentaria]
MGSPTLYHSATQAPLERERGWDKKTEYPVLMDSWVEVSVPFGHAIMVSLVEVQVDLRQPLFNIDVLNCSKRERDRIKVYAGGREDKDLLWISCYKYRPPPALLHTEAVHVHFFSDSVLSDGDLGFRLLFSFHNLSAVLEKDEGSNRYQYAWQWTDGPIVHYDPIPFMIGNRYFQFPACITHHPETIQEFSTCGLSDMYKCNTTSEVSAFIVCLITLERFLVIRFPLSSVHFVRCQTGICIPLPITRQSFAGHQYSFGVIIVLNFVLFLFIAAGQVSIYWSIRANSGTPVPGQVNVAMAIIVLPLNSALNPFLYTLNMILERRERAREERMKKLILAKLETDQSGMLADKLTLSREAARRIFDAWMSRGLLTHECVMNSLAEAEERKTVAPEG